MNKAQRYDPNGSIRPSYTIIVIFVNTIFKCFISESLRNVVVILFKCKLCELSVGTSIPAKSRNGAAEIWTQVPALFALDDVSPNVPNAEGWSRLPYGPFTGMALLHQPILHEPGIFSCNNILKDLSYPLLLQSPRPHWCVSWILPNYWKLPCHRWNIELESYFKVLPVRFLESCTCTGSAKFLCFLLSGIIDN